MMSVLALRTDIEFYQCHVRKANSGSESPVGQRDAYLSRSQNKTSSVVRICPATKTRWCRQILLIFKTDEPDEIGLYYQRRLAPPIYWVGAGIGRMLDTFQPSGVVTRIKFIRNRVGCAGCPATPMVNMIGT
jgi:hypothetical protein